MEKRIALECGNLEKAEVTTLNLDHCKSSSLCGLNDEFVSLESLSLINNGLSSLEGFPNLLKLRKLELADNFLTGGFDVLLGCPNLQKINLSGNKIKDVECLRPLSKLPNLVSLDLYSNEITSSESFPSNVKLILPNVQSFCEDELEGLSSGDDEGENEDEEGTEDDDYEDEEASGEDEIEPIGIDAALLGSSSGGKIGPSAVNGDNEGYSDGDEEEAESEDDDNEGDEEEEDVVDRGLKEDDHESEVDDEVDDDDDVEEDEEDEEEEDGEEGPGLAYLYSNDLIEEDDDEEFNEDSVSSKTISGVGDSDDGPTKAKRAKVSAESSIDNKEDNSSSQNGNAQ